MPRADQRRATRIFRPPRAKRAARPMSLKGYANRGGHKRSLLGLDETTTPKNCDLTRRARAKMPEQPDISKRAQRLSTRSLNRDLLQQKAPERYDAADAAAPPTP